jgi:hypothetical protein
MEGVSGAPTSWRRGLGRWGLRHIVVLWCVAAAIALVDLRFIERRGLESELQTEIARAEQFVREGTMPRTAYYPPMMMLIVAGMRKAGLAVINPWAVNFGLLAAGLVPMYALSELLLRRGAYALLAGLLVLLNPYFVWTVLLSRDSAGEFLFLSMVVWLTLIIRTLPEGDAGSRRYAYGLGTLVSAALLLLTRVTGFFMCLAIFCLALWQSRRRARERRLWVTSLGGFLVVTGGFCAFNYWVTGAFTLGTNGGYVLYLGNHPAYVHAHPHYDVDIFLARPGEAEGFDALDEANQYRAYTRTAIGFIERDPVAFVYRVLTKSVWYWLGVEKIPNYTTASFMEADDGLAHLDRPRLLPGLLYAGYRLIYLPAFLLAVGALWMRILDRRIGLLFMPLLGLWPVIALGYPDTRFRLSAEVIVWPALLLAWLEFRRRRARMDDTLRGDLAPWSDQVTALELKGGEK